MDFRRETRGALRIMSRIARLASCVLRPSGVASGDWRLASLAVVAVALLAPMKANANRYQDHENGIVWYYQVNLDGTASICNSDDNPDFISAVDPASTAGDILVPSNFNGIVVSEIGEDAFRRCRNIVSVRIPEGVKKISKNAFYECSLISVTFPNTLQSINDGAFYYCVSLTNVSISAGGDMSVGEDAFDHCTALANVSISAGGNMSIGKYAFDYCTALANVSISTVGDLTFGEGAFRHCSNLTGIELPPLLRVLPKNVFAYCSSLNGIELSTNIISIADMAFFRCAALDAIVFPKSVSSIGQRAFYECTALNEIVFSNDIAFPPTIGNQAFAYCTSVTNIFIADGITNIGDSAFVGLDALRSVRVPDSLQNISAGMLQFCTNLVSVSIPATVSRIGGMSFANDSSLVDFAIPTNMESVGVNAFFMTKFWNDWPDNSLVVKDGWLLGVKGDYPSLSLEIPSNVVHVADYACASLASITNIVAPATVVSIGAHAFSGCTNLAGAAIADSTVVDPSAFDGSSWFPESGVVDPDVVQTNYYVAFDANGGVGNMATQMFNYGYAKALSSNRFTRVMHVFDGWATNATGEVVYSDGEVVSNLTATADATVRLYAKWRIADDVYMVGFNPNGGDGNMATQYFRIGVAQALSTNLFTRSGYRFRGWSESAAGSVKYDDGAIVSNLTNTVGAVVSLYAKWAKETNVRQEIQNGIVWYYTAVSNDVATIENFDDDGASIAAAVPRSGGRLSGNVKIPSTLGGAQVTAIGDNAFAGCAGVTDFEIPFGVASIGSYAFAGCSSLAPGITIPESVETMGANMFEDCTSLKIVRYLGNQPDADANLYAGSPRNLISGVLKVRSGWETSAVGVSSDDDEGSSDSTNETATVAMPVPWPSGDNSRKVYWWGGVTLYTVWLRLNGGDSLGEDEEAFRFYVPGRPYGELPEPTHQNEDYEFVGWYTKAAGGTAVSADDIVSRSVSLYAHWRDSTKRESTAWTEELYSDDEDAPTSAATYHGYYYAADDGNDMAVAGLLTLKVGKSRYDRDAETSYSALSASVQLLGGVKIKLSGWMGEDGSAELYDKSNEHEMSLTIGANGFYGSLDDGEVSGARDILAGKTTADALAGRLALQQWQRTWTVILPVDAVEGAGAEFAKGYSVLSVAVGSKGKTKISGTMADGTRVSASAQMLVGDGCCCVPACVTLYGGKGGFAFLLWLSDGEESIWGLSNWNAAASKAAPFVATFGEPMLVEAGTTPVGAATFTVESFFDFDGVDDAFSPDGTELDANWKPIGKADMVRFAKDDGAWYTPEGKDFGNPAGLTLSYTASTGLFKGSFKVFGVTEKGTAKKWTAKVYGAVVDGVGYGTATIKKVGSIPVVIE